MLRPLEQFFDTDYRMWALVVLPVIRIMLSAGAVRMSYIPGQSSMEKYSKIA